MQDRYADIKNHFRDADGVTVREGRGAQGIKADSVMFAMFFKGDLLLRLPVARVTELVDHGDGRPYDPGTGPMNDRVVVPYGKQSLWIALAEESQAYVSRRKT